MKIILHSFFSSMLIVFLAAAPARAAVILAAEPDSVTTSVGSLFKVAITVTGAEDLYGVNLSLNYDAAKVKFVSVTQGDFFASGGSSFFVAGVDDGLGSIAFNGEVLIGDVPGVTGNGNLLNFTFEAFNPGLAAFGFADTTVIDAAMSLLAFNAVTGAVMIAGDATSVPEPSAPALLLLSVAGLFLIRRRDAQTGQGHGGAEKDENSLKQVPTVL